MELSYRKFKTPLGPMVGIASLNGLVGLDFTEPKREGLLRARIQRYFSSGDPLKGASQYLDQAEQWLDAYFTHRVKPLPKVKLDLKGTEFELEVWKKLVTVPLGDTWSYGELAKKIGKAKAARAVGGASRRNPVGLIVPCHRIIGATGHLTGYGGGLDRKEWLLKFEQSH